MAKYMKRNLFIFMLPYKNGSQPHNTATQRHSLFFSKRGKISFASTSVSGSQDVPSTHSEMPQAHRPRFGPRGKALMQAR